MSDATQPSRPSKSGKHRLRWAAASAAGLIVIAALWAYHRWHSCLPQLEGTRPVPGLSAAVSVERDALGIPTIRALSRLDAMRTLGWLHAQDRFFQMDLQRRRAAGELAELFGAKAVPMDRETRRHDFRSFARQAVAKLPQTQKELVTAYTEGVNAGLAALGAPPWEYTLLRAEAQPWREEDSILVGYSITLSLQDGGRYERSLSTLRDLHGESAVRFFAPQIGPDDAAVDGTTERLSPTPGPRSINLRKPPAAAAPASASLQQEVDLPRAGSNAFALSGRFTRDGAALLANDMHLGLSVPTIWYRAVLTWKSPAETWIGGLSLPGTPGIIVGSNRHVAWGLTHCPADTTDLVQVIPEPEAETLYRRQGDLGRYDARKAIIKVKGAAEVEQVTQWTDWGPVVGKGEKDRPIVLSWTAHSPEAIDFTLTEMDAARTVDQAIDVARRCGLPALNFIVADEKGDIAWTVAGRLPKRIGYDGRTPTLRLFGDRRWEGFLAPQEHPVLKAPREGWIASANERMWGGSTLALLGDGGYDNPHRIRQIQEGLRTLATKGGGNEAAAMASPADLFAIQLDDRARFLERWRELALKLIPAQSEGPRAAFRRIAASWDGRASTDSSGHLLLREFRRHATRRILEPIFAECADADSTFNWRRFRHEPALWALIESRPTHLLSPEYSGWDEPLLAAIDDVIRDVTRDGTPLEKARWGTRNTARIQHPISRALPSWLGGLLDMPALPLAGDSQLPRVANPSFGASERLVVSPGREKEGICHLPGGQSGHPGSPFYRAGFEAWAKGEALPFLPGKAKYTLSLAPAAAAALPHAAEKPR